MFTNTSRFLAVWTASSSRVLFCWTTGQTRWGWLNSSGLRSGDRITYIAMTKPYYSLKLMGHFFPVWPTSQALPWLDPELVLWEAPSSEWLRSSIIEAVQRLDWWSNRINTASWIIAENLMEDRLYLLAIARSSCQQQQQSSQSYHHHHWESYPAGETY